MLLILLLILSLNFTSCQVEPNFLVIFSLASIHFEHCFKHMNPCFTALYNQMLSLAIGSTFHIFHHNQLQKPLMFCTNFQLINCMQRKCISAVLRQNPIKHPRNIHQMYSSVFIGLLHIEDHPTGFSQASPSCTISPHFFLLPPHFLYFFCYNPPSPLHRIYNILIGPDKPPHMLFSPSNQNFLFGDSPISILAGTPLKGTCSFNRP